MPHLLVTGAGGQLGRAVMDEARQRTFTLAAVGHRELGIEDADAVRAVLAAHRPQLVINCAAWTDVDGCERDPARAQAVNAAGAGHVAAACRELGAVLVHISTDFVFDGGKRAPYAVGDPPAPLSEYGCSKMDDLYAALGYGRYSARQVLHKLAPDVVPEREAAAAAEPAKVEEVTPGMPGKPSENGDLVLKVKGMDDLLVYRARCCNPIRSGYMAGAC